MTSTTRQTFRVKAPRLSLESLTEVVRNDVLAPAVRDVARSAWLHGSFADPRSGIDREDLETPGGPNGLSDVDVFVVVEGWGDLHLSTRFTASQHGLLCRLAAQGELDVYTGDGPPDRLDRPAVPEEVRSRVSVPTPALERTICRAERTTFHVREFDVELLQFRALDLTLGGQTAFEQLVGDEPRLQLWPTPTG